MGTVTFNNNQQVLDVNQELDILSEEVLYTYQEINLLYDISQKLGVETELYKIGRIVLEAALSQVPARRASVMVLDKNGLELTVIASKGIPLRFDKHPKITLEDSMIEPVVNNGFPLVVNDLRENPRLAVRLKGGEYRGFAMAAVPLVIAPMKVDQKVIGTINISDKQQGREYFTSRDVKILSTIASQAAIAIEKTILMNDLKLAHQETEGAFFYLAHALARGSEATDEDTGAHIVRVGKYARLLAESLDMDKKFCDEIDHFGQLHDVGKLHIHPDIIRKPGKLTEEEWQIIKNHCQSGAAIIGDNNKLGIAKQIALTHHERWDGTGYPKGLKSEDIPVSGRLTMMADIYDALRNARSYKPAFDHYKTYNIIIEGDGRTMPEHFDPEVLKSFKANHRKFEKIYQEFKD